MEDIIGGWSTDARFASFLTDWRSILEHRVTRVGHELASVDGLTGAVLAGSVGRGAPWPLSDIDLVLISAVGWEDEVRAAVNDIRRRLIPGWIAEGWWTGIDAGRLLFTGEEVDRVCSGVSPAENAIDDTRWFHVLDKAYGGRALLDSGDPRAASLATWATRHRFDPGVITQRLRQHDAEARRVVVTGRSAARSGDLPGATLALWRVVQVVQIGLMERWGRRDNSLGRFGSRFAAEARLRGASRLVDRLDEVSGLDAATLERRWAVAPRWVHLRHDRSIRSRHAVGDMVSIEGDRRDTLRVCARYAAVALAGSVIPAWLSIAADRVDLDRRLDLMEAMLDGPAVTPDTSPPLSPRWTGRPDDAP